MVVVNERLGFSEAIGVVCIINLVEGNYPDKCQCHSSHVMLVNVFFSVTLFLARSYNNQYRILCISKMRYFGIMAWLFSS